MFGYLRAFENAGVYDETLVFIVSDHGYPNLPIDLSTAAPALSAKPGQATKAPSLTSWSRGVPIFLAKNFNARGPLEISDAPVSLCDIPLSIYDALGVEESLPRKLGAMLRCHSIFAPATNRPPRMHYRYRAYRAQQRLPKAERARITFRPYVVDGHSWDPGSWHGLPVGSRSDSAQRGTHRRTPDGTWTFEPHAETSP